MVDVTLRSSLARPLTWAEGDANFSNLKTAVEAAETNITALQLDVSAVETDITSYLETITDARLLGRAAGSDGTAQQVAVGTGLSLGSANLSLGAAATVRTYLGLGSTAGASYVVFMQSGTAVGRTVESKLRDVVSVLDFGADNTGSVTATGAFQAAIDATSNTTSIAKISVPSGTYLGDLSTLSVGSRKLVWDEQGAVIYSTSEPPGNRFCSKYESNVARPWFIGSWGFANNDGSSTGTTADQPRIYCHRKADHSGGTAGANPSAMSVYSTVGANVNNYEACLVVEMDSATEGDNTISPNMVAAQIVCNKNAVNTETARHYSMNLVVNDTTTRKSSVSKSALTGLEINLRASGPDDSSVRHALAIIPAGYDTSADGDATMDAAIRILPSTNVSFQPITINKGVKLEYDGVGGYDYGYWADAPFATAVFDCRNQGASGKYRFGSDQNTNNDIPVDLEFWAEQANGTKVQYGEILCQIIDNTNAAYTGAIRIRATNSGTMTEQVGIKEGVVVGAPTGSYKGVGTINAAGDIYKNNSAYTNPDYVFEQFYTGRVVKYADKEGAKQYSGLLPLEQLRAFTESHLRLPGIHDGPMGMFERGDKALEKIEELTLYILELHERIKKLEAGR